MKASLSTDLDVLIIGAGIVGLATAWKLIGKYPGLSLAVLDKETKVAAHQTSHNSGVIHSGLYYKPGSLKAKLCVQGAAEMVRFCREHGVPYQLCGKVVVATNARELPALEELYRRGIANGVPNLRMLTAEEIHEIEPHTAGVRGMHVPGTGITDYGLVAEKYAELIRAAGGEIALATEVVGLHQADGVMIVQTTSGEFRARLVVNCAGLHSDRVSRMAGAGLDLRIVPFRGEYYDIVPEKHSYVRGLIYPVPDPRFPFLGVHFTRRVAGGVEAGPNAVLAFKREGYSKTSFALDDAFDTAMFPGFWKMAAKNWRSAIDEYHRSWSKAAFVRALQKLMPELTSDDLRPGGSGVRAQALGRDGKLIDDFRFVYTEKMIHVCNVPSPAATASLVIGQYIVDTIAEREGWKGVAFASE